VTISPLQVQYNGSTYYFDRWQGSGIGSYSGTNPVCQVTMNAPINELAFYTTNIGINNISSEIPDKYNLYQNYPNPFNPHTNIEYRISEISEIELKVYNLLGQEVQTMFKGIKSAGKYTIKFSGSNIPSGIYFYRLSTKNLKTGVTNFETKKMILFK